MGNNKYIPPESLVRHIRSKHADYNEHCEYCQKEYETFMANQRWIFR